MQNFYFRNCPAVFALLLIVAAPCFSQVAPIVSQISDLDVTANQSVSYTLENVDGAKLKAAEDAYQRAREAQRR